MRCPFSKFAKNKSSANLETTVSVPQKNKNSTGGKSYYWIYKEMNLASQKYKLYS